MTGMDRRRWIIAASAAAGAVLLAIVIAFVALGGCERKVRTETGTRVMCTYGHVVSDTVKVVEVPASQAERYKVVTKTITCDTHKEAEAEYAKAQALIAKGDLKGAAAVLENVVALDAGFKMAAGQLADIKAGKKPRSGTGGGSGGTGGTGGTTGGDKKPVGPVASLSSYVPDTIPGYTAQAIIADVFRLTRNYLPKSRPDVGSMVIVVEQFKNAAAAKVAMSAVKAHYTVGGKTSEVGGRDVYIGTDGHRFATGVFNDGGVLVLVEVGSESGHPSGVTDEVRSIVAAIAK